MMSSEQIENMLYNEANKINLEDKKTFKVKSIFKYQVNHFNLKLLTKDLEEFLGLELNSFQGNHSFNESFFKEL